MAVHKISEKEYQEYMNAKSMGPIYRRLCKEALDSLKKQEQNKSYGGTQGKKTYTTKTNW
jgi:hypothetical protein